MNLFNPESRIMQTMTFLVNLVMLQFLLILTSLPLFTVGASVTAVFSIIPKMEKDVYLPVIRTYFQEFKNNLKQATIAWLVIAGAAVVIAVDIVFFTAIDNGIGKIGVIIGYLGVIFLAMELLYVFPLMAWFHNTTKQHMVNALKMALGNLGPTLLILCMYAVIGIFLWEAIQMFLLFGLTVAMYFEHLSFKRIFRQYIVQDSEQDTV